MYLPDRDSCLPVHLAIMTEAPDQILNVFFSYAPDMIRAIESSTILHPFAHVASKKQMQNLRNHMNSIDSLLRGTPG